MSGAVADPRTIAAASALSGFAGVRVGSDTNVIDRRAFGDNIGLGLFDITVRAHTPASARFVAVWPD